MPVYIYRAVDREGKICKGKVERDTAMLAEEYVKSLDMMPIEVKRQTFFNSDITDLNLFGGQVSRRDLSFMCRQLAFILTSGIPVGAGISLLSGQSLSRRLKSIIAEVDKGIMKGESLSSCLKNYSAFSPFFIHMVQIGEKGGRLGQVMEWLADYYEKQHKMSEDIKSAMAYPIVVSVMMLAIIIVSVVYVVPNYAAMFESSGIELPLATRILISMSNYLTGNFRNICVTAILAAFGLYYFSKAKAGSLFFDRLMLLNKTYVKLQNVRFLQALNILLASGEDLAMSVEIIKNIMGNTVMNNYIQNASIEIHRGSALSKSLEKIKYVDRLFISMLKIGEETGRLPETVDKCAVYLQGETDIMLVRLNKLIEPAVTVILGAVLAFIMLAVMLPTFYMSGVL